MDTIPARKVPRQEELTLELHGFQSHEEVIELAMAVANRMARDVSEVHCFTPLQELVDQLLTAEEYLNSSVAITRVIQLEQQQYFCTPRHSLARDLYNEAVFAKRHRRLLRFSYGLHATVRVGGVSSVHPWGLKLKTPVGIRSFRWDRVRDSGLHELTVFFKSEKKALERVISCEFTEVKSNSKSLKWKSLVFFSGTGHVRSTYPRSSRASSENSERLYSKLRNRLFG